MTLELTPERATNEWLFLDTVRQRSTRLVGRHRVSVVRGTNRLV
jgi:alkaline phosphatase D